MLVASVPCWSDIQMLLDCTHLAVSWSAHRRRLIRRVIPFGSAWTWRQVRVYVLTVMHQILRKVFGGEADCTELIGYPNVFLGGRQRRLGDKH